MLRTLMLCVLVPLLAQGIAAGELESQPCRFPDPALWIDVPGAPGMWTRPLPTSTDPWDPSPRRPGIDPRIIAGPQS